MGNFGTIYKLHAQHLVVGERRIHFGHINKRVPFEILGKTLYVFAFADKRKFGQQRLFKSIDGLFEVNIGGKIEISGQYFAQVLHQQQIGFDHFVNIGSFYFEHHLVAIGQNRFINLRNRSGCERLLINFLKIGAVVGAKIIAKHSIQIHCRQFHMVLQLLQFDDQFFGQHILSVAKCLTKFYKTRPQFLQNHSYSGINAIVRRMPIGAFGVFGEWVNAV